VPEEVFMIHLFSIRSGNSGEIARRRLQSVLITDETGVSLGLIDMIREDIAAVLSRYADFDPGSIEVRMLNTDHSGDRRPSLAAVIPVKKFTGLRND
jgi:cell division topological specificity factor